MILRILALSLLAACGSTKPTTDDTDQAPGDETSVDTEDTEQSDPTDTETHSDTGSTYETWIYAFADGSSTGCDTGEHGDVGETYLAVYGDTIEVARSEDALEVSWVPGPPTCEYDATSESFLCAFYGFANSAIWDGSFESADLAVGTFTYDDIDGCSYTAKFTWERGS